MIRRGLALTNAGVVLSAALAIGVLAAPLACGSSSGEDPAASADAGTGTPTSGDGGGGAQPAAPRCGDGIVQTGEGCDDGNQTNDDACTNACALPTCGDGIQQAGEECDDGNAVDTDACTSACKNAACGDTFVQAGVEECDDGNAVDTDACTSTCKNAACGDGFIHAGTEACDGNELGGATCATQGFQSGTLSCSNACQLDTSMCNPCPNGGAYVSGRCWYASTASESAVTKCSAMGLTGTDGSQAGLAWDQATMDAVAAGLGLVSGGDVGCCVAFGWIQNGTLYTHNFGPAFYNWSGTFSTYPTLKACNPPAN